MMIARSAYTQLNHSPVLLAGTVIAIIIGFILPPIFGLVGSVPALLAWAALSIAYLPILRYHRLPLWMAPFLPVVALFYLGATLDSARRHWMGRGGMWKGRAHRAQGTGRVQAHPGAEEK
jgi:hypothetical protein